MSLDPISAIFDGVTTIINKIWPDATQSQKDQLTIELAQLQATTDLAKGQQAINQVEAGSANLFVSGWRPFIGWVCGFAFAYAYILQPFMIFLFSAAGKPVSLPAIDFSTMSTVLFGMLGLGGMRTYEKTKGVAK